MPGFTFEKISARRGPAPTAPQKPRGLISQMINRIAERRAKRSLRRQRDGVRRDEKSSD
jgi:hypothetical protein